MIPAPNGRPGLGGNQTGRDGASSEGTGIPPLLSPPNGSPRCGWTRSGIQGRRGFVEDLGSSNGTFVGQTAGPLLEDPIEVGPKRELDESDRIYVGAWTRIVDGKATEDEKAAAAGEERVTAANRECVPRSAVTT